MYRLPKSLTTVTTLSKSVALLLFIALPFLGFMMGAIYQGAVDRNFQLSNIDYSLNYKISPTVSSSSKVSITDKDKGKTVTVHLGDTLSFSEGGSSVSQIFFSNPQILRKADSLNSLPTYEAQSIGTTTVSITVNPKCYPKCAIASIVFSLTVIVVR